MATKNSTLRIGSEVIVKRECRGYYPAESQGKIHSEAPGGYFINFSGYYGDSNVKENRLEPGEKIWFANIKDIQVIK